LLGLLPACHLLPAAVSSQAYLKSLLELANQFNYNSPNVK